MGKLAEIKTKENNTSVEAFINSVKDEGMRKDAFVLLDLMKKHSKEEPKMWGGSLIGFGRLIFKSPKTGREVEWFKMGFSPRKTSLSLYLSLNINDFEPYLKKLGKHKTGVGCLYINKLKDIDLTVLDTMIQVALKEKQ